MKKGHYKYIIFLVLFVLVRAQAQELRSTIICARIADCDRIEKEGKIKTVTGVGLSVLGMAVYLRGVQNILGQHEIIVVPTVNDFGYLFQEIAGFALFNIGQAALGEGLSFWISGHEKAKKYRKILNKRDPHLKLSVSPFVIELKYLF